MASESDVVGIVGIGIMGAAVADALRPHHQLVVHDFDESALHRQREAGADVADSAAAVADRADVVLLSLPGPGQVRSVVSGSTGLAASRTPPSLVVDLSTVDPGTSREMAVLMAEHGVDYLDAPVLGRPHRCGSWTLPVGGGEEGVARARPVLGRIANRVINVGDHGSGATVKLLNNLMFGAINAITAETMGAAAALGVDPAIYYSTLAESGAASVSNLFREIAPKIAGEDWTPAFTVDLLAKDNCLGLAMLEEIGLSPGVARAVVELNAAGQQAGLGPLDTSALAQLGRPDQEDHRFAR